MVIDTSAILAILFGEPEALDFISKIEAAPIHLISAGNLLETKIVIEARKGKEGIRELEFMLLKAKIEVVPFDAEQAEIAYSAWSTYGKGNHCAGLNFGDCFAYALSKTSNEPLLFKGNDFKHTDIEPVREPEKIFLV